jgi:hypothetical protein
MISLIAWFGHGLAPLVPSPHPAELLQDFIDSSCVQFPTLQARYVVIGELFQSKYVSKWLHLLSCMFT